MSIIEIEIEVEDREWDVRQRKWEAVTVKLEGTIPAPIDVECLTAPDQLEVGDRVEVHARGHWYPGSILTRKKSGKMEVEYVSGSGGSYRKAAERAHLVPISCGLRRRCSQALAELWAAAVWDELRRFAAGAAPKRAAGAPCLACGGEGIIDVDVADRDGEHTTRTLPCDACVPDEPDTQGDGDDGDPDGNAEARWEQEAI